jgi:hypothetical protein
MGLEATPIMRDPEAILEKFPGPVSLRVSLVKKLVAIALFAGFAAFMAYVLRQGLTVWYHIVMSWFSLIVCIGFVVRGMVVLLIPPAASLRLDAEGFEVMHIFHRERTRWRDVRSFRADEDDADVADDEEKAYTVTMLVAEPGRAQEVRVLPDNYGLTKEQLTGLLEEWRARALAMRSPD